MGNLKESLTTTRGYFCKRNRETVRGTKIRSIAFEIEVRCKVNVVEGSNEVDPPSRPT